MMMVMLETVGMSAMLGILGMLRFGNVRNVENVRTLTDSKCHTFLEPQARADLNDGNV